MNLLDLLTSPWAIVPEKLLEIQAIYATHLRGDKIDITAVEARLGRQLSNEQQSYTLRDGGVAVLPMMGVMAPRANMFMQISGGLSTQMAVSQVESMRVDPRVRSAILQMDTPGGSVNGLPALGDAVRRLAAEKPVVAISEGSIASAGYWVAAACNAIFMEGPTDSVGSIGVYHRLGWDPKRENQVELVRGRYKRLSINGTTPDPEVLAHYEGHLDYLYTLFVENVAEARGVSVDVVLERMADGRIFYGQQALDAGMADGFSTVDAMAEQLATDPQRYAKRYVAKPKALAAVSAGAEDLPQLEAAGVADESASTPTPTCEGTVMPEADKTPLTREALERDHPALFASLRTEFTAAGQAAGAAAERDRVTAVRGAALPGHEKLIEALASDGKTTGPEAAAAVLAAERGLRQAQASAHANDAPKPAPGATAPTTEQEKPQADSSLPVEERCKASWDADPKLRAEFPTLAVYTAIVRAEEAGRVRTLGKKAA